MVSYTVVELFAAKKRNTGNWHILSTWWRYTFQFNVVLLSAILNCPYAEYYLMNLVLQNVNLPNASLLNVGAPEEIGVLWESVTIKSRRLSSIVVSHSDAPFFVSPFNQKILSIPFWQSSLGLHFLPSKISIILCFDSNYLLSNILYIAYFNS